MTLMNSVALVAASPHFGGMLDHLEQALGRTIQRCSLESVRSFIGPQTQGVLVLGADKPDDRETIRSLVQMIRLQHWPVEVLLLESLEISRMSRLDDLGLYVTGRFTWPTDTGRLIGWMRKSLPSGCRLEPRPSTPEGMIAERLAVQAPSLAPLAERLALAAAHDITVLLTGETGTGKTYLARLMHDTSPRRRGPFVTVPCGAIPSELLESTFFGHVRGSFTGADRDRQGKFAAAAEGTILLDEIDTLSLPQQASLLRVIETGEYEPVGSNQTVRSSARIIAASNWDLEKALTAGKFREDLFYRLNILAFHLPPLRERVGDIAPLVRGMVARFTTRFRKNLFAISPEAMMVLESHPWPGNIRQLENAVQQAVLCSCGPVLLPSHLPDVLREQQVPLVEETEDGLQQVRESLERNLIQRALIDNGDNRVRTARALGISRVTLYKKMKKYGL
jgi:transcriptional regulator with PAS, ATPase and Fis domain